MGSNKLCSSNYINTSKINFCLKLYQLGDRFHEDFTLPFTLSIPFTSLSLSPLYPFYLSIPFTSQSLSPLYPFHLSLSLSLYIYTYISYLSLPLYISPSTFLSLSFFLSSLYHSLWRI